VIQPSGRFAVIKVKKPGVSARWRAHGRWSAATAGPRPGTAGRARGRLAGVSFLHATTVVIARTITTTASITLRTAMADRIELFERRNRLRIVALVVLATLNYIVAVVMAAIALGLGVGLAIVFQGGDAFADADTLPFFAVGLAVVVGGSIVIGVLVGLFRIPFLRRSLERRVLQETGARIVAPDEQTEVRNLLEGLAIASGLPPPRVVVIDDAAPNSFGVGTRPSRTVVGITTGLSERLSRDELEAVLAYEVSRIRSWDVALSSWTVALTSGAISAVDDPDDDSFLKAVLGFVPRRLAEWLQVWALRDQGVERDRVAVQFTRNPASLIRALEKLDDDSSRVRHVSRGTGPLWLEFPAHVLGPFPSPATRRLARELLLDERITQLRELAGQPIGPVTRRR
jgi:heat shock protein HtpX